MTAKFDDCFTAKLVNRLTAKFVNRLTTKLMNCLTTKLMNGLTAKPVDRLTAKLVVVNLVKLHLTKFNYMCVFWSRNVLIVLASWLCFDRIYKGVCPT